jgi:DNA polymerase V
MQPTIPIPLLLCFVQAGFPSPADDHIDKRLDLNEYLIRRQNSTFCVRARGHSMTGAGILDGDLLIVDRAIEPASGHVIVAVLDGETTVKRLHRQGRRVILLPEAEGYEPITIREGQDFLVWGVVTHAIHALNRRL